MQIKFHYVKFKNLMSYGNTFTELVLDQHRHTIFTASNGKGKSAVIESICYSLYGKPYRNIKLGQLVNSINKKNLVAEISFSKGTDKFVVIRGQKPTLFEIYKNGELILEDAASKDYQAYLETEVLGINFKTFKQIIVMGSAAYVPFMNLSAAERRNITEEVLDISVFSSMSDIAKQRVSEYKSTIDSLTYEIQVTKTQIESQKELLETLTEEAKVKSDEAKIKADESRKRIADLTNQLDEVDATLSGIGDVQSKYDSLVESKSKLSVRLAKIDQKIETMDSDLEFYNNDSCPTCGQHFDETLRQTKSTEHRHKIDELAVTRSQLNEMLDSFVSKISDMTETVKRAAALVQERQNIVYAKKLEERSIVESSKDVPSESINVCKTKLKELVATLVEKTESKNDATKQLAYYKTSVEILKDSGIKAKVIATFIPLLNTLINEHLQKFDMFVSFELDETFNETIKSRDRDTFSYNSFSEGEKSKIDASILFAWRKIAMSRNSISTNILIFDETLDRGLDEESVSIFIDILSSIEESVNSIVISHRNVVPEMFDRHLTVDKVRDFSVLSG